jgi:hypothetical protein
MVEPREQILFLPFHDLTYLPTRYTGNGTHDLEPSDDGQSTLSVQHLFRCSVAAGCGHRIGRPLMNFQNRASTEWFNTLGLRPSRFSTVEQMGQIRSVGTALSDAALSRIEFSVAGSGREQGLIGCGATCAVT